MLFFFGCIGLLIAGYFIYGTFVDRVFGSDENRVTPAIAMADGIDYMVMPKWKLIFIQVLDIAGIGPIFGPILGALYGPVAMVWIVIGCIFGGAVHDYFSGMLSVRNNGASIPEVVGEYLGMPARQVMRLFSFILLMLVGVVFVLSPAKLLNGLTGINTGLLVACIFGYYFLATILPIDKIIGRIYPLLGFLLLAMTTALFIALMFSSHQVLPNLNFSNMHPGDKPIWPLLFITISCSAISGFHSTQSPLMARCVENERQGRAVFYGSMIIEGIIGLIWCALGVSFYNDPQALSAVIAAGSPSAVVAEISHSLLGTIGGGLAILAVIVLPITSGDTAFRSTRLIVAETFKVKQEADDLHPAVRHRVRHLHPELLDHLALLRLLQPVPERPGPVGVRRLPGPARQAALDRHHSGHLHDGRLRDLHRQRQDRFRPVLRHVRDHRHHRCRGRVRPVHVQVRHQRQDRR
jgi:carbon starvation protein CstA